MLYESMFKYGLHDCRIDNVFCENGEMFLVFASGVYELDATGKETCLTPSCRMVIEFAENDIQKIFNHIEITRTSKGKTTDIDYNKFVEDVEKYKFDVDINYFSRFCNTILIEGYISKWKYAVVISEVENIKYLFF